MLSERKRPSNRSVKLSLLLACLLLAVLVFTACQTDSSRMPEPIDPLTDPVLYHEAAQKLARSGNLHYRNFVIADQDGLIMNNREQQVSLTLHDGFDNKTIFPQTGSQFAASGEWIYFLSGHPNDSLRKIMLDGTNSVRIRQDSSHHLIATDDHLFTIDAATGQVLQIQFDGSQEQSLFEGFAAELIYDGQSLFVSGSENRTGLIQIDPQTGTSSRILSHRVVSMNRCGDWLVYADPNRDYGVFAYHQEQKKERQLIDFPVTRPFIVYDTTLYYLDTKRQNRLMGLVVANGKTDPDDAIVIVDDVVDAFVILPDAVYYRRPADTRIYRTPLSGGVPEIMP